MSLISSVSCLRIMAEANTNTEVSHVIDIVNEFRVGEKYLIIKTTELDKSSIQNKTINFNVMVHHQLLGIPFFVLTNTNKNYPFLPPLLIVMMHEVLMANFFFDRSKRKYNMAVPNFRKGTCRGPQWTMSKAHAETTRKRAQSFFHWDYSFYKIWTCWWQ